MFFVKFIFFSVFLMFLTCLRVPLLSRPTACFPIYDSGPCPGTHPIVAQCCGECHHVGDAWTVAVSDSITANRRLNGMRTEADIFYRTSDF